MPSLLDMFGGGLPAAPQGGILGGGLLGGGLDGGDSPLGGFGNFLQDNREALLGLGIGLLTGQNPTPALMQGLKIAGDRRQMRGAQDLMSQYFSGGAPALSSAAAGATPTSAVPSASFSTMATGRASATEAPPSQDTGPVQDRIDQAFKLAQGQLGKNEVPDRAALQDYLRTGGANLDPATTAWCAAFVNSTLKQAGIQGTGSNMAKSFLKFGEDTLYPQRGDVAVFNRGDPNSPYGHVGFFDKFTTDPEGRQKIRVLGGNQGNAVSYAEYDPAQLIGFRRAPGEAPVASSPLAYGGVKPASADPNFVPQMSTAHPDAMAFAGPMAAVQSGLQTSAPSVAPSAAPTGLAGVLGGPIIPQSPTEGRIAETYADLNGPMSAPALRPPASPDTKSAVDPAKAVVPQPANGVQTAQAAPVANNSGAGTAAGLAQAAPRRARILSQILVHPGIPDAVKLQVLKQELPDEWQKLNENTLYQQRSGQFRQAPQGPYTLSEGQERRGPNNEVLASNSKQEKQGRPLVTPDERAAYGIRPDDKGIYFVKPDNTVGSPSGQTVNVNNNAEKAEETKVGSAAGEDYTAIVRSAAAAPGKIAVLDQMEALTRNPNFYSGYGAQAVTRGKQLLSVVTGDKSLASANETFSSLAAKATLDAIGGSLGAQISDGDRKFIQQIAGSPENTAEGNRAIIDIQRRLAKREMDTAQIADDVRKSNGGHFDQMEYARRVADFAKKNPLFPEANQQNGAPSKADLEAEARRRGLIK